MRFKRLVLGAIALASATMIGVPVAASVASAASAATVPQPIVIGAVNFPEDLIVAYLYSDVLQHAGFQTLVKPNLGTRSVVEPALANGQLDIEPDYAGTLLLFLNPKATKAANQISSTVKNLKALLTANSATVDNPAPAIDSNVFVVTKATAAKYHLSTVSSLKNVASKMVLGGPRSVRSDRPASSVCRRSTGSTSRASRASMRRARSAWPRSSRARSRWSSCSRATATLSRTASSHSPTTSTSSLLTSSSRSSATPPTPPRSPRRSTSFRPS